MKPIEMKTTDRLMTTFAEATYDSLDRERKGMELIRPMIVQMTIETMKQSEPCGAVSCVMICALAMLFEPACELMPSSCSKFY